MTLNSKAGIAFLLTFFIWFLLCLPSPLFDVPTSTILLSEEENLLGAKIAADGQWRFPANQKVPEKFKLALINYEDKHFYHHLGINPVAIFQAIKTNFRAGEIKRGGSTISQQTIRLARKNPKRTYREKLYEMVLAVRLELGFSKEKILRLYTSNAPFGGNVVGLDAAAWRYFGRSADQLSWAEAATLAVLPNSPGLIHPGKNRDQLKNKRDFLLKSLFENHKIDEITYENALQEPLPIAPVDLPQSAMHLLEQANIDHPGKITHSSIEAAWQELANKIVNRHYNLLKQNKINNVAAIIIDVNTKQVKAYVGNSNTTSVNHNQVDMIRAPRSTGSLLKPFLYAANIDEGNILPSSLVVDIPTYYNNYSPKNFTKDYKGAIPADKALATSLNIPAVRQLHEYGIPKFHNVIQNLQLKDIRFKPSHYGLSLILGGAESSLWDMSKAYAGMASTLNHFNKSEGKYFDGEFSTLNYKNQVIDKSFAIKQYEVFSAASIWHTMNALVEVKRPGEEKAWEYFSDNQKIAWKTGTSFGNKDAWAIGVNPNYVVGVWVGNADGEGRTGNTGLASAAPILFDLIEILPPSNEWFKPPVQELFTASVCTQSGFLANKNCIKKDTILITVKGLESKPCAFHQQYTTSLDGDYLVNRNCESIDNLKQETFFVLPPRQEIYYVKANANYKKLPPLKPSCNTEDIHGFSILYPPSNAIVSVPVNIAGEKEKIVAKIAHKQPADTLFWYLDEKFIGKTSDIHEMPLQPIKGDHLLGVIDVNGNQLFRSFSVK